ncbi:hypothetical protein EDEG_03403 [Edhazardia aedis USNM 41457]|uniref:Thioredoxin domain-containing protein n=1 Tax=Edhazardia aedis (strain USNM 41457) TaxID=1003232 RepID=J9D3P3_EDHAE|nr:hypothetical protein EDEG_03403 [Edhazardia aedis USNM 41457]|eukprot:EJW02159.1 hypothetical protein EDEG_03403 [Edhazardia aedis USNM 41457]
MLIFFITHILCEVFEKCDLPSYEGLVIHKFYRDNCPHCQRIAPLIEEIDDRLETHGIKSKVRSVECKSCDCSKDKIDAVPTIIVTRDGKELDRFRGYHDYEFIAEFVSRVAGINPKILERGDKETPGKVVKLKADDFYSIFSGPWLILFYNNKKDRYRELMVELGKFYLDKLNIAEAHESEAKNFEARYGITEYPTILALYNGVMVEYTGQPELFSLIDFCDTLIAPVFVDIKREKFDEIEQQTPQGEPIFLVFYSHLALANSYFMQLSHEMKFRVKLYKTGDKDLIQKAGIHPKDRDVDVDVKDNEAVILTVYRNGIFHRFDGDIGNNEDLLNWIYHAHYPLLTRISPKTFSGVFFGFKPVILLITRNEHLVHEFEAFIEMRHKGLPYTSHIFAAIEFTEFPGLFTDNLPGISVPAIIVYDPQKKKFYGEHTKVDNYNLKDVAYKTIKLYEDGKLKIYKKESHGFKYIVVLLVILAACAIGIKKTKRSYKTH